MDVDSVGSHFKADSTQFVNEIRSLKTSIDRLSQNQPRGPPQPVLYRNMTAHGAQPNMRSTVLGRERSYYVTGNRQRTTLPSRAFRREIAVGSVNYPPRQNPPRSRFPARQPRSFSTPQPYPYTPKKANNLCF